MNIDIIWQVAMLVAIGGISGFLNVMAGGGSLLTLPLLIFLGLPAVEANGTNRVAILVQNFFALKAFQKHKMFPAQLAIWCAVPALAGAFVGANLAVNIDDQTFKRLLAGIMIGVLVLMLVDPMKRLRQKDMEMTKARRTVLVVTFFGVGIYGGFVQAAVGFLILTALMMFGLDLVRSNAIKIFVIFLFTVPALAIFAWHGEVNWLLGSALAVGNACGGRIASNVAIKKGHDWIRKFVSVVVVIFALKLFFS